MPGDGSRLDPCAFTDHVRVLVGKMRITISRGYPMPGLVDLSGLTASSLLQRHMATHLIFGPLSRGGVPRWIFPLLVLLAPAAWPLLSGQGPFKLLGALLSALVFVLVGAKAVKNWTQEQLLLLFAAMKVTLGLSALLMAFLAGPVHLLTGQPDAWPVWGLGLVWLPGLEYVQRLTVHQKYITLSRIGFSLPLIWWGASAGGWTM